MAEPVTWLFLFVALYGAYCLYWAVTSSRERRTASDFFLAGRQVSAWVFALTATALTLSGWMFFGHPSLLYLDGFQYAELTLAVIVMPLAGILFLKRQWLLSRRHGYVTPGEMLADYFGGEAIRVLVVLIALAFAVPFAGMQLLASGRLIEILTGGAVGAHAAMWVMTFFVFLYAAIGGWRAVTSVGALQALLLLAGMIGLGCVAYLAMGGFGPFNAALAKLGAVPGGARYLDIPAVIRFTRGLDQEMPAGGIWTTSMILSYALALAGLQSSPAFSILGFSCRDLRGFAPQQVWATGAVAGLVLLLFAIPQGLGAHFLGATKAIGDGNLLAPSLPALGQGGSMDLTAHVIGALGRHQPWFMALFAVCGLAAIHLAAALFASGAATTLAHDVFKRFVVPTASDRAMKLCARIALAMIFLAAVLLATFLPVAEAELGTLALGFGLQLWPALAAACWIPWITRQGATLGLIAGLIAVVLTEPAGGAILHVVGVELPWGRWPWTIHSAGWGLFCNLVVCVPVSLATFRGAGRQHRSIFHDFLQAQAALTPRKAVMRPAVWALTLVWLFFALGPGAIIGNDFFGAPEGGLAAWRLGVPSLWAWQTIWWALGVLVIWWLAYKMELSTAAPHRLEAARLSDDPRPERRTPPWIRNFLRRVT